MRTFPREARARATCCRAMLLSHAAEPCCRAVLPSRAAERTPRPPVEALSPPLPPCHHPHSHPLSQGSAQHVRPQPLRHGRGGDHRLASSLRDQARPHRHVCLCGLHVWCERDPLPVEHPGRHVLCHHRRRRWTRRPMGRPPHSGKAAGFVLLSLTPMFPHMSHSHSSHISPLFFFPPLFFFFCRSSVPSASSST